MLYSPAGAAAWQRAVAAAEREGAFFITQPHRIVAKPRVKFAWRAPGSTPRSEDKHARGRSAPRGSTRRRCRGTEGFADLAAGGSRIRTVGSAREGLAFFATLLWLSPDTVGVLPKGVICKRDRRFESRSLQRRVACEPKANLVGC